MPAPVRRSWRPPLAVHQVGGPAPAPALSPLRRRGGGAPVHHAVTPPCRRARSGSLPLPVMIGGGDRGAPKPDRARRDVPRCKRSASSRQSSSASRCALPAAPEAQGAVFSRCLASARPSALPPRAVDRGREGHEVVLFTRLAKPSILSVAGLAGQGLWTFADRCRRGLRVATKSQRFVLPAEPPRVVSEYLASGPPPTSID